MASTHAANPDGLEDLSSGSIASSIASTASLKPTFEQLNATLLSRGYISSPLSVAGMHSESVSLLANALHSLIAQREHDAEFSQALAAKNRTLAASLDRNVRFLKEERQAKVDAERKEEVAKAKTANLATQLQAIESEARQTREDLAKSRRELATIKASAAQLKVASERGIERLRTRFGEGCTNALRGSLPSVRVLDGAFAESSSRGINVGGIERRQIEELEMRRAELTASNTALRRFAVEAVNAARNAACRLEDLVEVGEEEQDVKRASTSGKSSVSSQRGPLYQRDLFPVAAPFAGSAAESNTHPAWQALHSAAQAIQTHTTALDAQRLALGRTHAEALRTSQAETADFKWKASLGASASSSSPSSEASSTSKPSNEALAADYKSSAFGAARGPRNDADHRIQLELKLQDAVARLNKAEAECNAAKEAAKKAEKSERALRKVKGVKDPISTEQQAKDKEEAERVAREREEERTALDVERARFERLSRETEAEREALQRDLAEAQELKIQAQTMLEAASRSVEAAQKASNVEQEQGQQGDVSEAGTVIDHEPTPPAPIRTFRRASARLSSGSTIGATSIGTIGSSVMPDEDVRMVDVGPAPSFRPASRARITESDEMADSSRASASSSRGQKRRLADEVDREDKGEAPQETVADQLEDVAEAGHDEGFAKPRARPTLVPRRPQPRLERQSDMMPPPSSSSTGEDANDENARPRSTSGTTARRPRKGLMAPTASSMARATPSSRKVVDAIEQPQRGSMAAAAANGSVKRPRTLGAASAALGRLVNGAESSSSTARRQR